MNIVIDLCVESDGLMFAPLMKRLQENGHDVLLTARHKVQATDLYRYEGLKPYTVGKYATDLEGKLLASSMRIYRMTKLIKEKFEVLDAIVSNTGVEASRVGFGLGASVHTFHDHPEAIHQMHLTIPLSHYVYYPWTMESRARELYPSHVNHVPYKGFLHMAWMPDFKVDNGILHKLGLDPERPVVIFRESEVGAAYLFGRTDITLSAITDLASQWEHVDFVARPRYSYQVLKSYFKGYPNVKIFAQPIDLQSLEAKASLLIGGGATMCLEATYFGTPTIMCRQITSPITDYLDFTGLAKTAKTHEDIIDLADSLMGTRNTEMAKEIHGAMEFPLEKLIENIEEDK